MDDSCEACGAPLAQTGIGRPRRWCSDKCRKRSRATWVAPVEHTDEPGPVEVAVRELVESTGYDDGDPRRVLAVVALRLAASFDSSGSVTIARELRGHVASISEFSSEAATIVDDMRARRAARRVEGLIRAAEEPG